MAYFPVRVSKFSSAFQIDYYKGSTFQQQANTTHFKGYL